MILAHVEVGENIKNVAIRINRYFYETITKIGFFYDEKGSCCKKIYNSCPILF